MKILGIIPARFASSRFPGKPLADIAGKSMIERVYEQVNKAIEDVVVATDNKEIYDKVKSFGGQVEMTTENHRNGTSRCFEVFDKYSINKNFDIIINIQGDEPLISPLAIKKLISAFEDTQTEIATLVNHRKYSDLLLDSNIVKVIRTKSGRGAYFSRSLIPYIRDKENTPNIDFYTHIGIYAFSADVLRQIIKLKPTITELSENLEQNRWIENDFYIKTVVTEYKAIGVDTPADIQTIIRLLKKSTRSELI